MFSINSYYRAWTTAKIYLKSQLNFHAPAIQEYYLYCMLKFKYSEKGTQILKQYPNLFSFNVKQSWKIPSELTLQCDFRYFFMQLYLKKINSGLMQL